MNGPARRPSEHLILAAHSLRAHGRPRLPTNLRLPTNTGPDRMLAAPETHRRRTRPQVCRGLQQRDVQALNFDCRRSDCRSYCHCALTPPPSQIPQGWRERQPP
eukprot:scaffold13971_cov69-Phaeocystis_antarctica.AAC.11